MKTRKEVEELKTEWLKDPVWDIEDTDGFEEYKDELEAFHNKIRSIWKQHRESRGKKEMEQIGVKDNKPLYDYLKRLELQIKRLQDQIPS